MDSFWQQHRTFVLKIGGGLMVVLVCWIIGASMTSESLSAADARLKKKVRELGRRSVASVEDRRTYEASVNRLRDRIQFLAQMVGEVRRGEELRQGLIREILAAVKRDSDEAQNRYLELARGSPVACVVGLVGEARDYLVSEAGLANVLIDEDLGFGRLDMEPTPAELDRYLLTLKLIVNITELAISEQIYEVKAIRIGSPPGGKFQGETVFVRQYPVSITVRGRSRTVLRFLQKLSDARGLVPVAELRRLSRVSSESDPDVVVAEIELRALRIDPEGEYEEKRR